MNHIVAARLHAIDATPAPWRGGVDLSPWSPRPRLAEKGLCEDIGRHWLIRAQVFLTDSDDEIRRKIMTHAFSGGRETAKLQRELGADLDIDVAYQWLRFFLEDDEELEAIGVSRYGSGQGPYWNTAAVKERLVVELQKLVRAHKARRDVPNDGNQPVRRDVASVERRGSPPDGRPGARGAVEVDAAIQHE